VAAFFGVNVWKQLEEHEVKIAAYTFHNQVMQVTEAQAITGRRWQTSKKDMEKLVGKGILEFVPGGYPRDPKAHYRLVGRNR
jgi:ATP-dependent DNA helicase RecG